MTFDAVVETLHAIIHDLAARETLPPSLANVAIDRDTCFADLSLDSVGRLALLGELETRCDVLLSESDLVGLVTIGDLARVTARALDRAAMRRTYHDAR